MSRDGAILARAVSDADDRLVTADEPLAGLQLHCGGELPGTIAVPALLETVRKARRYHLKLARAITAQDGDDAVTAWVEVEPREDGEMGCEIRLRNWRSTPLTEREEGLGPDERRAVDRHLAEFTATLDFGQRLLTFACNAPDLVEFEERLGEALGRPWTDFVTIVGSSHRQPMHWRLLDGAEVRIDESDRLWRASLVPLERPGREPDGFELMLVADQPVPAADKNRPVGARGDARPRLVGQDIAPVLRQPIARIIANAESIRTRLAGPLSNDYAEYAAEIANAGQHLLGLLDDLADLEVVESEDFATEADQIDLADVARQAAGILSVRAREKDIAIDAPRHGESLAATAEFRRVLQILLNLIGNAIRYSPEGSQIWIRLEDLDDQARITVADQGPGLSEDEQDAVFEKFERLGRSGDGGSGLGLYISRRLARAMNGELSVESEKGQGARFRLDLQRAPEASGNTPQADAEQDRAE